MTMYILIGMPFTKNINTVLHSRFRPLYVAAFFQGLVFWYPIEKLFMSTIGFNQAVLEQPLLCTLP
jgi:hypothetical protein